MLLPVLWLSSCNPIEYCSTWPDIHRFITFQIIMLSALCKLFPTGLDNESQLKRFSQNKPNEVQREYLADKGHISPLFWRKTGKKKAAEATF
ncbi:hypothetical protein PL78_09360 [Yersinia entomophaga]|uniref:Uncharacterized protein n=1 Tax=Yersinia entomophaga TaxID=935293 RepID=A0ABM6BK10_YERET|nr:hypothetical protein PL78_09360 [Yersinia entomophaga]OWF87092.1 hypothetical protein B4914_12780 [Yersinia entomophaga]